VVLYASNGSNVSTIDPGVLDDVRSVVDVRSESFIYGPDLEPPTDAQFQAAYNDQSDPNFDLPTCGKR
jgi:hypothetical protein